MEAVYPYANIIHLVLAIMFLGYVFTDVVMISKIKDANKIIGKTSFKIFPITLLIIVLSGGMMMSKYINSSSGFFETDMQKLLVYKITLASIIVLGVLFNLFTKFTGRQKPYFMVHHFHKLVLVLGLGIVILAKMMFTA